jgi:NADPH-dependent curcumin reductase CurA
MPRHRCVRPYRDVATIQFSGCGGENVTEQLGFDACINYRTEHLAEALARTCPKGIDINFENVGGNSLDAVLDKMNLFGRVSLCGLISQYNDEGQWKSPKHFPLIIMQRLRVQGFIVLDYQARFSEVFEKIYGWMKAGRIKWREHIVEGLENAPDAVRMLFGQNKIGKLLLKVSD